VLGSGKFNLFHTHPGMLVADLGVNHEKIESAADKTGKSSPIRFSK
jgi:hypothetical protein